MLQTRDGPDAVVKIEAILAEGRFHPLVEGGSRPRAVLPGLLTSRR